VGPRVRAAVASTHYDKVKDLLSREAFDGAVDDVVREWGGLLDRDAAGMLAVERLGRSVAAFTQIADLEEGMEVSLRAEVVSVSPVREFSRQDGTKGRVVNLEVRDSSGGCRFVLWDDDVVAVDRGRIGPGSRVRALDCFVRRTSFGLEVSRGKFGALVPEAR